MIQNISITTKEIETAKAVVRKLYKNDAGNPFELTTGQAVIFTAIWKKKHRRIHVSAFTRYGKSETIAMAVLTRVTTHPEKFAIVAGNRDKANIIMAYIIKHIFDNPITRAEFIMEPGESEESIRRYKNKSRINFRIGDLLGEVFITTAAGALGFGAPNVVCDEAALIDEKDYALVLRMLGDKTENTLIKVGNPWDSEHFRKSFEDPNYAKIIIDYKQGIEEGRFTEAQKQEMEKQPFFDVLYECKFPPQGQADEGNWVPLITRSEIECAFVEKGHPGFGVNKIGADIAGGGRNFSVIVQRHTNVAKIIYRQNTPDTMVVAEKIITIKKAEKINRANIAIDKVGIGKGVYDVVNRDMPGVIGVNAGEKLPDNDPDKKLFINLRAKMYWKVREWLLQGGKLEEDENWFELTKIKYRTKLEGTQGKLQIMPKEMMLKDGIDSPDVADGLSMTFAGPDYMMSETVRDIDEEESLRYLREQQRGRGWDPHNPFPDLL